MKSLNISIIPAILSLVIIILLVTAFINISAPDRTGEDAGFNASYAIDVTASHPQARDYMASHFKVPEWRVVNASLVTDAVYDADNNIIQEGHPVWKVLMMERSCACSSVKDLYVVEAFVSPDTGEIISLTTGPVLESQYDKQTCASTTCH